MSEVKLYTFAGAAGCYVYEGDYKKIKAENDDLRRIMRMAAGKIRSHAIAQPDRAWEKIHDALGLLDHGNRSPENH